MEKIAPNQKNILRRPAFLSDMFAYKEIRLHELSLLFYLLFFTFTIHLFLLYS